MLSLFDKLIRRGLLSGIYPESQQYREKLAHLLAKKSQQPVSVYTGFDATSNSLHVGNLATIVNSLYFYSHGHQVVLVIGDATAQIGDPSGHAKDRKRIPKTVIADNAQSIETTLRGLFRNFHANFMDRAKLNAQQQQQQQDDHGDSGSLSPKPPIIVRNSEWYKNESAVDFVDVIFRDVRVGGLLHKKSIQERLQMKEGMNMAEFCYQIFQAYDWLELRKRYNCQLQIGGNDQQGNIYTGHDLIKKILNVNDSIGLLAPLITNSKGKKLGKTTEGLKSAIWLKSDLTSPYDLYQYFHRTPDDDVEKFLRIFSFYSEDYINDIIKNRLKDKSDVWYCQRKLAEHACLLVHGCEGLADAKRTTESLFPRK